MASAAMPLVELEQWLQARVDRHPAATSIPMLDGYAAAIVAGPVSMSPLDWICPLLAIDAVAFNHAARRSWPRYRPSRCATATPLDRARSVRADALAQSQWQYRCRDAAQAVGVGVVAGRRQRQSPAAAAHQSRRSEPSAARTVRSGREAEDFLCSSLEADQLRTLMTADVGAHTTYSRAHRRASQNCRDPPQK
ncbi:hypothetical protein [Bradyrhizobium australafricanum]|uniref:hypothetical protein n=1 Tax=Bradyrhizobium australafricanum TaxID=2821406 RepID=UPI001CE294BE|nr:hypothetical protein [Bradyrhizobium australafricanum]